MMLMYSGIDPISQTALFFKVVCQNVSSDYSIAILVVDDAWIMYQAISIREEECVCFDEWTRERSMEETFLRLGAERNHQFGMRSSAHAMNIVT